VIHCPKLEEHQRRLTSHMSHGGGEQGGY